MWRVFLHLFSIFNSSVQVAGEMSEYLSLMVGVRQGAPLSVLLSDIYIDDLLEYIYRRIIEPAYQN